MEYKPTVLIAGDVCPADLGGRSLLERLALDARPELFVWTLDAALAEGPPRSDYSPIAFDPAALDELQLGRTNLAVTASNHLTDFGEPGVRATLSELDARGIRHVGSGLDRRAADQAAIVELPVGRVAVLAFAETQSRVGAIAATAASVGVRPFDVDVCREAIAAARKSADWVWVVLHWGHEFVRFPDPTQRRLAWEMIDAGADLVAASHTHVPLGFERRGKAVIFYGLGNFLYPPYREARGFRYRWIPAARQGVVAAGRFVHGQWEWTPLEIRHCSRGLPRLERHGNCRDYGAELPASLDEYSRQYPKMFRRERAIFCAQRLTFMSWQERAWRVKDALGVGRSKSAPRSNGSS